MARLSVLTADDEPHARRYIKALLSEDKDVEVVYECRNGQEVLNFLKNKAPDIIFLDINMPGISGVEVAAKLKDTASLIIFSTAYDEYALKAFELQAFDYLLKPFDKIRFQEVLNRAKSTVEKNKQAAFSQKFAALYEDYSQSISPYLTQFRINDKGFERTIRIQEVLYIEASSVYAVLHLEKERVLYRVSLQLLEQQLPDNFLRVHRSFIINTDATDTVKYLNNNTYMIRMKNEEVIISSRKYKSSVMDWLSTS
ncbi:LytR/AlgR family response regulator transcription factor [Robertkochia flava]|uniref:LytR/AlgR family response regulator transcription factor n=1 Tax=Robertkochia flava TaxID=3447986 RepID=UPI001CCA374D|nr:LytTR family DNA-binding domain-containing protein [Robertkochia marina]